MTEFSVPKRGREWRFAGCDQPSGRLLDRSFHNISHPDQVVSGGGEGKHPTDSFAAAMFGLAQTGGSLDPAEGLFHELAFSLALVIAIVTCGAFINAARTS